MELDVTLILGLFGACMVMCTLFVGGGVALGAGITSLFSSGGKLNANSILFIASVILFLVGGFLFLKSRKMNSCCAEPKKSEINKQNGNDQNET